jgi:hypothetical protein
VSFDEHCRRLSGRGSDDFRRKISELNATIEATVEFRRRERANAYVGLIDITGHSGRLLEDPRSTHSSRTTPQIARFIAVIGKGLHQASSTQEM